FQIRTLLRITLNRTRLYRQPFRSHRHRERRQGPERRAGRALGDEPEFKMPIRGPTDPVGDSAATPGRPTGKLLFRHLLSTCYGPVMDLLFYLSFPLIIAVNYLKPPESVSFSARLQRWWPKKARFSLLTGESTPPHPT